MSYDDSVVGGLLYSVVQDSPVAPLPQWIADRLGSL